jgi:hypothetical protein
MSIRVPAIVTCCGIDIVLPSLVTEVERTLATENAEGKRETWRNIDAERMDHVAFDWGDEDEEHDA